MVAAIGEYLEKQTELVEALAASLPPGPSLSAEAGGTGGALRSLTTVIEQTASQLLSLVPAGLPPAVGDEEFLAMLRSSEQHAALHGQQQQPAEHGSSPRTCENKEEADHVAVAGAARGGGALEARQEEAKRRMEEKEEEEKQHEQEKQEEEEEEEQQQQEAVPER
eukprot:1001338-Rhodomonas_salina.1